MPCDVKFNFRSFHQRIVWTSFGSSNCMLKHKTSKWCKIVLAFTWSQCNVVLKCPQIKVSSGVVLLDFIHNISLSLAPLQGLWGQGHSWAIMDLSSVLVKLVIMEAISTGQLTALWGSLEVTLLTVLTVEALRIL